MKIFSKFNKELEEELTKKQMQLAKIEKQKEKLRIQIELLETEAWQYNNEINTIKESIRDRNRNINSTRYINKKT